MENNLFKTDDSPQSLISLAIEKGANIEQLEKLLTLKERWDAAQANKSFISAMSNFQKEVPAIEKKKLVKYPSKTGGMVNYKYAELGEIDESIKSAMAANGLSKRWEIKEEGDKLICTCIISHIDGHTERTSMSSIKDMSGGKNEIQSRASAISYLQRYTLIGVLGLTTATEDNDGDGTPDAKAMQSTKPIWKAKDKEPEPENIEDEPFEILGHWHAKMEKCKSKADVLAVYQQHKETVDAHPELQKLLKQTQDSFKKLQTA